MDYWLEGDLKVPALGSFEKILEKAVVRKTGWPPFWLPTREDIRAQEIDDVIECWLAPQSADVERGFSDPAHCDFWRASPDGKLFLIRGYQEDSNETFPAGSILDTTLPLWRMGEVILHADRLASLLRRDPKSPVTIHFRVVFTGLNGRVLRSWANPLSDMIIEGHAARSDEAVLETSLSAENVEARLAEILLPLVSSLFDRFGIAGLSNSRVENEVQRLLNSPIGKEKRTRFS
jgi:transcriptional regulator with XRE-family HTH domain